MKQNSRTSYWFLPVVIILLFVLVACVRPVPGAPDETETTPVSQPTQEQPPTQVPSTETPIPDITEPDGTEPTPEGVTEPNPDGEDAVAVEPSPASPTLPTTHTVQSGETLFSVSQQYGITQEEIAAANNLTTSSVLTAGQLLQIPAPSVTQPSESVPATGGQTHVVQPGENLFRISLRYGKTVDEVAAYNGIANPHYIYPGQVIRIP